MGSLWEIVSDTEESMLIEQLIVSGTSNVARSGSSFKWTPRVPTYAKRSTKPWPHIQLRSLNQLVLQKPYTSVWQNGRVASIPNTDLLNLPKLIARQISIFNSCVWILLLNNASHIARKGASDFYLTWFICLLNTWIGFRQCAALGGEGT